MVKKIDKCSSKIYQYSSKNKGFTLIELLAVIALLAILIIIAVPNIMKMYNNAKNRIFELEIKKYIKIAQQEYDTAMLENIKAEDKIYTYEKGKLRITSSGEIELAITDGRYCAKKSLNSDLIIEVLSESGCQLVIPTPDKCFVFDSGLKAITGYNSQDSDCLLDVVIPSQINGTAVEVIYRQAFYSQYLTSVIIPDSVITIGKYAFEYNNLTSVDIPTSVTTMGGWAFSDNKLTSIDIPNSIKIIDYSVFGYNKLTSVKIPTSVTSILGYAFYGNQLTDVTIPDSVTTISGGAFGYNKLINLTISNNITTIPSNAFSDNELTGVTIPTSVTTILDYAFYDNKLTSIFIPNSVTSIGTYAFAENDITEGNAKIDNFSTNVTIGNNAFANNGLDGLTTIPPTFK